MFEQGNSEILPTFGLNLESQTPEQVRGNLHWSFVAAALGSVITGSGAVIAHASGYEGHAVGLGALSQLHLFASGFFFGRLKSQN